MIYMWEPQVLQDNIFVIFGKRKVFNRRCVDASDFLFLLLDIQSITGSSVMEEPLVSLRSSKESGKKSVSFCFGRVKFSFKSNYNL